VHPSWVIQPTVKTAHAFPQNTMPYFPPLHGILLPPVIHRIRSLPVPTFPTAAQPQPHRKPETRGYVRKRQHTSLRALIPQLPPLPLFPSFIPSSSPPLIPPFFLLSPPNYTAHPQTPACPSIHRPYPHPYFTTQEDQPPPPLPPSSLRTPKRPSITSHTPFLPSSTIAPYLYLSCEMWGGGLLRV